MAGDRFGAPSGRDAGSSVFNNDGASTWHRHYALWQNTRAKKSSGGAPRDLGRAEACCQRILLAHVGAASGLTVIAAPTAVVNMRRRIDPDDGIVRAVRLGLGFGRILALVRRGGWTDRNAAALGHERALGFAARLDGRLVRRPVAVALRGRLRLRDRPFTQASAAKNCRVGKRQDKS
jgi:DNA-directed RNA polymerase subunit N (RpoN/RPB10)